MNDLRRNLAAIYTMITIILAIIHLAVLWHDSIKKMKNKELWQLILLIILFLPIVFMAFFIGYILIYSYIASIYNDSFVITQILTNIFNYILIYRIFVGIKELKNGK